MSDMDAQPLLAAELENKDTPAMDESKADDDAVEADVDKKVGKREVKRSPNRLMVDEAHGEGDNSCVMLSAAKMEGRN